MKKTSRRLPQAFRTVRTDFGQITHWRSPYLSARCRVCGCTDLDCRGCIERTGTRCHWVEPDLCSACADQARVVELATEALAHFVSELRARQMARVLWRQRLLVGRDPLMAEKPKKARRTKR